jgi:hypothetical protein
MYRATESSRAMHTADGQYPPQKQSNKDPASQDRKQHSFCLCLVALEKVCRSFIIVLGNVNVIFRYGWRLKFMNHWGRRHNMRTTPELSHIIYQIYGLCFGIISRSDISYDGLFLGLKVPKRHFFSSSPFWRKLVRHSAISRLSK